VIEQAVRDGSQSSLHQQRDNLCGPFQVARVLLDAGVTQWDGTPLDQDLVALHAGTTLPAEPRGPQTPAGATSLLDYRYELRRVDSEASGTTPRGLAAAIALLSGGRLETVPLRGRWSEAKVERLLESAPSLGDSTPPFGARLIANLRTGPLWGSRPPVGALLAQLAGHRPAAVPHSEWDVGHFVELVSFVRGSGGALVVVRDSYPSLGWNAHHLQPPQALVAALARGDGHQGGVLTVVGAGQADGARTLAVRLSLETEFWDNGTQEVAD
jgi:hypothetical protein